MKYPLWLYATISLGVGYFKLLPRHLSGRAEENS
jgi:hypothetical protein